MELIYGMILQSNFENIYTIAVSYLRKSKKAEVRADIESANAHRVGLKPFHVDYLD